MTVEHINTTGPAMIADGDRPLAVTQSICPHCKAVLDATLVIRDGRVVLCRDCPDHGPTEAVVYGDAERYLEIQRFNKPGESPRARQTEASKGCPHDCGICPEHRQHTCLGIIEVNTACNLDCPICFAGSGTGPQEHGYSLTIEQVETMLDAFVRAEGLPEAVQLSGGEPTIHPRILDMLAAAKDRGIPLVMLNTNGIRLARDRELRARVGRARRPRLPAVRRVRRADSDRDPWALAGRREGTGAGPLRRGRCQRLAGRHDRAGDQRARARRDHPVRHRPPGGDRGVHPAGHPLGPLPHRLRPAAEAHQLRRDRGRRRTAPGVVSRG